MPSVVDKRHLEMANGRLWGAEMVMGSFVGPPLAGLLLGAAFSIPFFLDAGTFAVAAALVFMIGGSFKPGPRESSTYGATRFWDQMKEGVRWLWNHELFRPMAISLGVLNATMMMALATFVLFAQEVLELDATRFGLLTTGVAAGGVIGSVVAHRVTKALGQGPSLFAAILLMAGSCWSVVSPPRSGCSGRMGAVTSATAVIWNVITVSLRQSLIPDNILGRVNSVYRFFGWGMMPIGSILGGLVVAWLEPAAGREGALRSPFLIAAAITVGLFVYALPRLSTPRIEEAKASAEPESTVGHG